MIFMTTWTKEELNIMSEAGDLFISIPNKDGSTHAPTFVWGVVVDDQLYCRGYNGINAAWYLSAKREGKGHITMGDVNGSVNKNVSFEFINDFKDVDKIDAAYKQRFSGSEYLDDILTRKAQEATVKIIPC